MSPKRLTVLVLSVVAALVFYFWGRPAAPESGAAPARPGAPAPVSAAAGVPDSAAANTNRAATPAAAARSTLADGLNSPNQDIFADLRQINDLFGAYRSNFPRDGNPSGSNAEITAALAGKNRLQLALIPPDHPAINRDGELCDRWGTPFFLHPESGARMDLRSAGPDRKMWTDDDLVFDR
ncbi:MAG: hypothetical protein B9S34_02570 [Opitutia bacterium Tous-C1TDCM]|nr:MAG: hypothetical protein B9S34_02570 [Opitutae bacterium Tous-C1TDCM]